MFWENFVNYIPYYMRRLVSKMDMSIPNETEKRPKTNISKNTENRTTKLGLMLFIVIMFPE